MRENAARQCAPVPIQAAGTNTVVVAVQNELDILRHGRDALWRDSGRHKIFAGGERPSLRKKRFHDLPGRQHLEVDGRFLDRRGQVAK